MTKIRRLYLGNNHLSGDLLPLAELQNLEVLKLSSNNFSGPIPTELGSMSKLWWLQLDYNSLTGSIPASLGQLRGLHVLDLQGNQLEGSIPAELGNLTEWLWFLALTRNNLDGAIPPELAQLKQLKVLDLGHNGFSGPIPPELGQLGNLENLSLSGNQLSGPLPDQLGSLVRLRSLQLDNNQLSGLIPPTLSALSNLRGLWLSNNQLSGPVPTELSKLSALGYLDLSNNLLTGPLPQTLTALQLNNFRYQGTDLCEPGDAQFQTWLATIQSLEGTNITCGTQTVAGLVWNDINRNGAQDAGEAGLAGATVTLTQTQTVAAVDAAGRRVFTDTEGRYRFDYVATGPHAVSVAKPGFLATSGTTVPINVPEGGLTIPPVGIAWASTHVYLPLTGK